MRGAHGMKHSVQKGLEGLRIILKRGSRNCGEFFFQCNGEQQLNTATEVRGFPRAVRTTMAR